MFKKINTPGWSVIAFSLSLCSYLYELLLIQFASELSNNNFLIINLSLGSFILGLGLGLKDLPILNENESIKKLIKTEKEICLFAILSWIIIQAADFTQQHFIGIILNQDHPNPWFSNLIETYHFYILVASIITSILIGYKSGQELPLILNISNHKEKYTAFFFSLTYLGSVVAAFLLNFVLKPFFSASFIFFIVVLTNLLIFIILNKHARQQWVYSSASIFLILLLVSILEPQITQAVLKNYFYRFSATGLSINQIPKIIYKETPYQKINIHDYQNKKILSLNRQFQFSFSNEELYHDALIHIPLKMFNLKPKNVLLLGGGDGLALRELLKHPEIKSIKQIELDSDFTEFCRTDPEISKLNQGSLEKNPRVTRVYGDAFFLIKQDKLVYDLIVVDFPYPFSYDIWKLYSLEFYLSIATKMNQDSLLVLDAPVQNANIAKFINNPNAKKTNSILYSTLSAANFKSINMFSFQKEGFIAVKIVKEKPNYNFLDYKFLNSNTIKKIPLLKKETFDYANKKEFINSIFEPKFLYFSRDF